MDVANASGKEREHAVEEDEHRVKMLCSDFHAMQFNNLKAGNARKLKNTTCGKMDDTKVDAG